jgi:hypothetical protein
MICQAQVTAIQVLSGQIGQLDRQLRQRVARLAPSLLWLRAADRGQAHRRDRRGGPVPLRGLLCHARRGGTGPGQFRPHRPPPVTRWQPPAECRPAPHRDHPAAPFRPRPELLSAAPVPRATPPARPSAPSSAASPGRLPAPQAGPTTIHHSHSCRLTEEQPSCFSRTWIGLKSLHRSPWRYDLKLWIGSGDGSAAYLPG